MVIGIALIAALLAGKPATSGQPGKTYTCTVNSDVGLDTIKITNQNTGQSITLIPANLPYSFNYTGGDTLQFAVTAIADYAWNAWVFSDSGTFDGRNPLALKASRNLMMTAKFMVIGT